MTRAAPAQLERRRASGEGMSVMSFAARAMLIVLALAYVLTFLQINEHYLVEQWPRFKFVPNINTPAQNVQLVLLSLLPAFLMNVRLSAVSDFIILAIYFCVYAPTIAISSILYNHNGESPLKFQLTYLAAMLLLIQMPRLFNFKINAPKTSGRWIEPAVCFMAMALALTLAVKYRQLMNFVHVDDIYDQRASISAQISSVDAYLFAWLEGAVCPFLITLGIYRRNLFYLACSVFCIAVLYGLLATKTSLATITLIPVLYFIGMRYSRRFGLIVAAGTVLLNIVTLTAEINRFDLRGQLAMFWAFRSVGLPSIASVWYQEFFAGNGHTFLSHAFPFNRLISYPYDLPVFQEIARAYFGSIFTANAHFWATDGSAGFGLIGVPLLSLFCGMVLAVSNACTSHVPRGLLPPLFVGFAMNITNISLFTAIFSGGLFLLLLFLLFWQPQRQRGTLREEPGGRVDLYAARPD